MRLLKSIFYLLFIVLISCNSSSSKHQFSDIEIQWELLSNTSEIDKSTAIFSFTNNNETPIIGDNWTLYFNQANVRPSIKQKEQMVNVSHINGDWYKIIPEQNFHLAQNETREFTFQFNGAFIKYSDAPKGLYFVIDEGLKNEQIIEPTNYKVAPFTRSEQINRAENDYVHIPSSETRYIENDALKVDDVAKTFNIIPSPYVFDITKEEVIIPNKLSVFFDNTLRPEANYLKEAMGSFSSIDIVFVDDENADLILRTDPLVVDGKSDEAYSLNIDENGISIIGNDNAGIFYGIQSLFSLLSQVESTEVIRLPKLEIKDAPRFSYRGFQLDVGRNFQSKETIKKTIDLLATYKINKFLFYLTEDEGWRLEIDGLPELTEIGSMRRHTSMESSSLHPSYGSGPFPDSQNNYGTGYYTKEDFIEILTYAKERHVMVIPEVNLPGHARAAIKAMEYRYERLISEGEPEEAEKYRLIDPDDESRYISAQSFKDNIACVCRPSLYTFYEKVIDEIIDLYKKAEAPLEYFHTGGDEVPRGPWTQSPICNELIKNSDEVNHPNQLQTYFFRKTVEILNKRDLKIAGWEEVALKHREDDLIVNEEFKDKNVIPYVWNNLWGAQDLGYKLANRGYKVVLCPVTNFYFDLAYNKDPEEPGLYWAGFVNTENAYEFAPFDMFKTTYRDDSMYSPIDPDKEFETMERLRMDARKNILGLQSQLWGETLKGGDMLEHYLLPKLLAFSESAWAKERVWETINDPDKRNKAIRENWRKFVHDVGENELPKLDNLNGGYAYRIPPPGAIVKNDTLYANVKYSQLILRYTTDGSEPTEASEIYSKPINVSDEVIKLKSFNAKGRSSKTSTIHANPEIIKP